jgi:hypothetical protein
MLRVRQMLKLTPAGRRVARQGWRKLFRKEADLDMEAILRIVDIAAHCGASKREILEFLDAMASQRSGSSLPADSNLADGIVALQRQWSAARTKAEAKFLAELATRYRGPRPTSPTKQARTKVTGLR